ncbi:tRNA pseudouridine(38-40) synthase TruA [Bacillaceae bacterium Marseille-Q3522]|nr:tRNA pseudouridine(38-40) synthase TruA [Bacillaceae bacterium Marseille-Q3522]
MARYKCTISYDGSNFCGYQIQPHLRTVQGEMERALKKLHKGLEITIHASGRTDSGVHAKGQVFHFDSPFQLPLQKWEFALNKLLPGDIVINKMEKAADDFHARFDTIGKEYRYQFFLSRKRDPFHRNYAYHYRFPIQIEKMKQAAEYLIGTHDFTSFCSAKTTIEDKVRTIHSIDWEVNEEILVIRFIGDGFLRNMVRIIVGTLLDVGINRKLPQDIKAILVGKDRRLAGKTAPPEGLYLWHVFYYEKEMEQALRGK